jgi:hypothetical protein
MSRTLAAVLGITLGLPVLAMIAITATGSVKADFLMSFLTGGVLMAFAVAAIFEIRRLADVDSHEPAEAEPALPAGPPTGAQAYDSEPAPSPGREIRVSETAAEAAPIVVPSAGRVRARRRRAWRPRRRPRCPPWSRTSLPSSQRRSGRAGRAREQRRPDHDVRAARRACGNPAQRSINIDCGSRPLEKLL